MNTPESSTPAAGGASLPPSVEKLFLTHSSAIKGFIHSLLRDRSLVDDVLQETFLVVCAKRNSFSPGTNFVAWACVIARYKVLETLRSRSRLAQQFSAEVVDLLAEEAPRNDQREAMLRHLESCLRELPAASRRVIELRYFRAKEPDEIAGELSHSVDSVYVAMSRARSMLRRCVAGKMAQSG